MLPKKLTARVSLRTVLYADWVELGNPFSICLLLSAVLGSYQVARLSVWVLLYWLCLSPWSGDFQRPCRNVKYALHSAGKESWVFEVNVLLGIFLCYLCFYQFRHPWLSCWKKYTHPLIRRERQGHGTLQGENKCDRKTTFHVNQ